MNENTTPTTPATQTKQPAAIEAALKKHIFSYRETTGAEAIRAAYFLLGAISDAAERMSRTVDEQPSNPAEIDASDLLVDLAGWAEQIRTFTQLAQNELFQLMS